MHLSLLNRISIFIAVLAILALVIVHVVLRPRYEEQVITEHRNTIQQIQSYAVADFDQIIANWSDVTNFIGLQVKERPKEGEIVLRSMITLHPEIVQIKIHSSQLADELASQNTSYPQPHVQIMDSIGIRSKLDSVLTFFWAQDSLTRQHYLVARTNVQVEQHPFILTVVWDAKKLLTVFSELPFHNGYSASILCASSLLLQNNSSFKQSGTSLQSAVPVQRVRQNEANWSVLTGAFRTVQLWLIVAVPEKPMLLPVEELVQLMTICIIGLAVMTLLIGWMLSSQIRRPLRRLVKDVQNFQRMDFTQAIQVPPIRDLRRLGETLEELRRMMEKTMPEQKKTETQEGNSEKNGEN